MSELDRLERFLRTDPRDVGCDEAVAVLHVYVDLMAAGEDAAGRYPGVAAHLLACGPEFFGQRVSVDEVRAFKPSPAVYRHAAERLSVTAGQVRLVTSNAFDCVGASAAGMRTAWVNRSAAPFDTIGAQPDLTVPALDRLPAALRG